MKIFDHLSLKKKMITGGAAPMILIVALGLMSFQSIDALLHIGGKVDSTNQFISELNMVNNSIARLESLEKNFLVTGEKKHLTQFSQSREKLSALLAEMKKDLSLARAGQMEELEKLLALWYGETGREILAREKIDMAPEERAALREKSGEVPQLRVEDLIAPEMLRKVQKYYAGATGVASLVVEKDGTPVKLQTYDEFQKFCFGYQRKNKKGLELCMKSDAEGPQDAKKAGRDWYYCYSGGLIDFGFPITVDGMQIGNWLGGQILLEAPDEEKFRKQAEDIGIEDKEGYIDALRQVPIVGQEKLEAAIELLKVLVATFGQMGNDLYLRKSLVALVNSGGSENIMEKIRFVLENIRKSELEVLSAAQISAAKAATLTKNMVAGGTVLAFFLSLAIAFWISRGLLRQLGGEPSEIEDIAKKVSEGDLTIEFSSKGKSGVYAAMKKMVENLRTSIADVQIASGKLAETSLELKSRSEEMSQGASEQAASAEEVSASMEEMTAAIRQNADNAGATERIALQAAQTAGEGGKAVAETVTAIQTIAERITVIQEIARETNMLALNAAIESARAGSSGRGFSVVAAEVRKLSEQIQKAAKKIISVTASGVTVAENAGGMLSRIVPDIRKTAELVQEISSSSQEQHSGADQINKAIQQLDQIIQQNAAISEEMASTSEDLSEQADRLRKVTEFFKIGDLAAEKGKSENESLQPEDITAMKAIIAKFEGKKKPHAAEAKPESRGGQTKDKSGKEQIRMDEEEKDIRDEFEMY
ncbi:MAG: PocR ligand-binding domain-containing protein [Desulfococcaceae bacterium]